jgi:hypothetical protein
MARDAGFSRADIDATMLDDVKFRRLWRVLNDETVMALAVTIYLATVLRSWHDGEAVSADDAVPMWLGPNEQALEALTEVDLLDADHRIPAESFAAWIGPAFDRRERKRAGGREGGLRSHGVKKDLTRPVPVLSRPDDARGTVEDSSSIASGKGEPRSESAVLYYFDLTKREPTNNVQAWVGELEDTYGTPAVRAAMDTEWSRSKQLNNLLSRVEARLKDPGPKTAKTTSRGAALEAAGQRPLR